MMDQEIMPSESSLSTPVVPIQKNSETMMDQEIMPSDSSLSTPVLSILPLGIKEFIPFCPADLIPKVDQSFKSPEDGGAFYKKYALGCGFDTRLATTKRTRDGTIKLRNIACNKEGFRETVNKGEVNHNPTNSDEPSEPVQSRVRLLTRMGCKARIQLNLGKDGSYFVNRFHEGHTHPLVSPESLMFLKENRNLTSIQKNFIVKVARLKIGGVKAFRGWKELSGGYKNVGATKNDFKNFIRDLKKYIGDFDGQMFIENFIRKKENCNSFYFDLQVIEDNRLCRVFWADTISRKNYALFGDMTAADGTFRTNKYNMVFVPFTGVDHHKRCVTFGAGLLASEDADSYTWLFNAF